VAVAERPVVCVGDNCLDLYLPPVDRVLVGGSTLNVAVGLARRGLRTAYVGPVADDRAGEAVLSSLAAQGLDASHVRVAEGQATAVTEIALEEAGERRFLRESYAIHEAYAPSDDEWEFIARARFIHASRLPHQLARLVSLGRDGARVSYDFSVDPLPTKLDGLELVFVPHDRLQPGADPAESARDLVGRGCACAVVTLGAEGSLAATATERAAVSAVPLDSIVDTCGAGDAFIAAFIAALLAGRPLEARLGEGAQAGAEACSILGAFPQEALPQLALR
jgi:fructoselysine 6-kinase